MDESTLFIWQINGRSWQAYHLQSGLGAVADSRGAALADWERLWNSRSTYKVVDGPPPQPRREYGETGPAIQGAEHYRKGYAVYRELLKTFHADVCGDRTFSGDEVTAALIRLWEAVS